MGRRPNLGTKQNRQRWPDERDRRRWREDEPLAADAPRVLALAVLVQAVRIDLHDPARTLPVLRWLAESGILPEEGPAARRKLLPEALRRAEAVLRGEEIGANARRYGRRLSPHHAATLARLVREHRERVRI
jgi:hypothetical protein